MTYHHGGLQDPMVRFCEHGNELSGVVKAVYFFTRWVIINLLRKTLHQSVTCREQTQQLVLLVPEYMCLLHTVQILQVKLLSSP